MAYRAILVSMLLALGSIAAWQESQAQSNGAWIDRFDGEQGLNGGVNAIAIDDSGTVYIGGSFTEAGGQPVNHLAKWTGTAWDTLGSGLEDGINALAIAPTGELYAGGDFVEAGGREARFIARWNGEQWEGLGQNPNGHVFAVAANDIALYVGGRFNEAGGERALRLARWDGAAWHAVGGGVQGPFGIEDDGRVYALALDDGGLYVGGHFLEAGGQPARNIARWNGSTWEALAGGIGTTDQRVWSIVVGDAGVVYVGGSFTEAGGQAVNHIARWTGAVWEPLGTGVNGPVYAIALGNAGEVYVGGDFTEAGGRPANNIARWTGRAWEALGNGVGPLSPWAIARHGQDVYVGGSFAQAGGMTSRFLAVWQEGSPTRVEAFLPEEKDDLRFETVYPNPFNAVTTIEYVLLAAGPVRLTVYDVLGRPVATLVDGAQQAGMHRATFDATRLAGGTYLYQLMAAGKVKTGCLALFK